MQRTSFVGCAGGNGASEPTDETQDDSNAKVEDDDETAEETDNDDRSDDDKPDSADGTGEFELHHLDVDQADSTLLVTPDSEAILIDTGNWRQDGQGVIDYLEEHNIERIDHLVATHAHADHIGGHAAVIEHFETNDGGIGAVYDSGVAHDTAIYDNYLDAIEEHDVELFEVEESDRLPLGKDVTTTVLNPPVGDSGADLHYNSITIVFEFGDFGYLTTGDAEDDTEERLVEDCSDKVEADAYQAGHQGSSTSSTPGFMNTATPEIAVISSGYENKHGHPHDEVLERYSGMGIETYWTGVHGDTVLTTDGDEINTETAEEFSTDPNDLLEEKPDDEDVDESPVVSPAATHVTGTPNRRMMDGTYTGTVDRIVNGRTAVILLEDDEGDDVIAQLGVDVTELPEKAHEEGGILRVTVEDGKYVEAKYVAAETEHRQESTQKRLGRLSKQLSDSS